MLNRLVQDSCFTKPKIFLPKVLDRKIRSLREGGDPLRRVRLRPVISNQHFKIFVGLRVKRLKHQFQRLGPVVGG